MESPIEEVKGSQQSKVNFYSSEDEFQTALQDFEPFSIFKSTQQLLFEKISLEVFAPWYQQFIFDDKAIDSIDPGQIPTVSTILLTSLTTNKLTNTTKSI